VLARRTGLQPKQEAKLIKELSKLPALVGKALKLSKEIKKLSKQFSDKHHSLFLGRGIQYKSDSSCEVINLPNCPDILDPIVFTIPLQLLAYHVAIIKGTDIDHPRNLAKSVTVE